ncbi:hypothetical protein RHSIM_Rhsim09G0070000 [Rhododendron simsii]|uniref:Endonuclease/exonuclease/phosphatase domain-containing protein n=1 Tax=Rhododendron simsii TaxID=118357 RepID=A0A834GGV9_RHOSS|nr:hypothetical protein RHSIM_Rhsim09G0070000 [Rhododendron simsii]
MVLLEGPWSVMKSLMILRPLEEGMVVSQLQFSVCPFWVQIHGLPVEKMSRANAEIIGRRFGKLLALETSPDNVLLARSFLRVRVEIDISKPLPKGPAVSCQGMKKARQGRARKGATPIEEIRHEVNEAERRVESLLARGPEKQRIDNKSVEGTTGERVGSPSTRQIQVTDVGGEVPRLKSRTSCDVTLGPGVNNPEGTAIYSHPVMLSSAQGIFETTPTDSLIPFADSGPGPNGNPAIICQELSDNQSPNCSQHPEQATPYIVTEPPDSPRALKANLTPISTHISPAYPLSNDLTRSSTLIDLKQPPSPNSRDIALSSVFKSLAIKRKAQEDLPDGNNSKILRICSPIPNPTSAVSPPNRPIRKTHKNTRASTFRKKGGELLLDSPMLDTNLIEVQVQQYGENYVCSQALIPMSRDQKGENMQLNDEGRGIGRTLTTQALGDLVSKNRPSIIFLMETKNNKVKMETIRRSLKFDNSSYVDPEGLSGGLALWWTNNLEVEVEFASRNLLHVIITDKAIPSCWATTFVYCCPTRSGRELVWNKIKRIAQSEVLPWLCMGDFNQVARIEDKIGGTLPSQNSLASFHDMLSDCGLVDLDFKGPKFTWRNNRSGDDFIMERIDMAFANSKWRELHEQAMVFVEAAVGSDHNPLILNTSVPLDKVGKPFKFESFWVTDEECKEVVTRAWNQESEAALMESVCKKLCGCKEKLKEWNLRKFGNLKLKIAALKDHLLEVQKHLENGFHPDLMAMEKELIGELEDLWQKNSMYWHQRFRVKWLQMGDRNSHFFHLSTIQRRQRNQIMKLKDSNGDWKTEHKEVADVIKKHFQELYKAPPNRCFDDMLSLIDPVISPEWNEQLSREVTRAE